MNKWTKSAMVSVLAVVILLTTTSCSTSNTAGSTRNVVATGKYALYTKPRTVKGAKLVASKSMMKKFASYTRADTDYYELTGRNHPYKGSAYYFHVYGYKVTHTGSIYYHVVTMNGNYRGYVYGGKKVGSFAGGVKKATTTQPTTIPADFMNYVGIAIPGTVWNYPPYTQYKTKRLGKVNWTIPSLAKFKVTKAVKRTREQDTYFYLKSQKSSVPSGWVNFRYVRHYSEIEGNEGIIHN
ncbi:MAG: hypothetical protein ABF586_11265 [Sporolactobacillus sp.]